MTTDELRAAYPGAADAVAYHQRPGVSRLLAIAAVTGASPEQAVEGCRQGADDAIRYRPGLPVAAVRAQMDHPDFLRYVADKLRALREEVTP